MNFDGKELIYNPPDGYCLIMATWFAITGRMHMCGLFDDDKKAGL